MSRKLELQGTLTKHIGIDYNQALEFSGTALEFSGTDQGGEKHQSSRLNSLIGNFLSDEVRCGSMTSHKVKITVEIE